MFVDRAQIFSGKIFSTRGKKSPPGDIRGGSLGGVLHKILFARASV